MTDQNIAGLSLYQYDFCPYCLITRRVIQQLKINIEIRDTQEEPKHQQELLSNGGKSQVPCLRIEHQDSIQWMYESADIIQYLNDRFGQPVSEG